MQVVHALTASFLRLLDESDGDDEDESTMAALGIMQALTTMMEAVSSKPEEYAAVEEPLMPLFTRCCREDAEDFFDEMLEVLQYLTFYTPVISARLWTLVPLMHEAFHTWAREYINGMLPALDNFVHRSTELFLSPAKVWGVVEYSEYMIGRKLTSPTPALVPHHLLDLC